VDDDDVGFFKALAVVVGAEGFVFLESLGRLQKIGDEPLHLQLPCVIIWSLL
jgi:hypothetical protein